MTTETEPSAERAREHDAKIRDLKERAARQPISYKPLFDQAIELAEGMAAREWGLRAFEAALRATEQPAPEKGERRTGPYAMLGIGGLVRDEGPKTETADKLVRQIYDELSAWAEERGESWHSKELSEETERAIINYVHPKPSPAAASQPALPVKDADEEFCADLRERAGVAREEGTGTAQGDAWRFDKAAERITDLRSRLATAEQERDVLRSSRPLPDGEVGELVKRLRDHHLNKYALPADFDLYGLAADTLTSLAERIAALEGAIRSTATQGSYDELAIRKAVGFELAELICDARALAASSPRRRSAGASLGGTHREVLRTARRPKLIG